MHLRIALLAAAMLPLASDASAELPFCKLLHHRGQRCCDDCQVHVHVCKPPSAGHYQPPADAAYTPPAVSQQLMYAPVQPSTIGYTMPMMQTMSTMPMMMPYPVQQVGMGMPTQPQMQQHFQAPAQTACGGCEDRITRLETGMKHLNERMDRIELILENQVIAMEAIGDKLKTGNKKKVAPQ